MKMTHKHLASFIFSLVLAAPSALWAQAPARVVGSVTAADVAARTLTVKDDSGKEQKVKVAENARISQLAPGETSLANAKPGELTSVAAGDRVLARGPVNGDVLEANLLVLMSMTDIAKRQQADQMAWATKGILGLVTAVDPKQRQVTLKTNGPAGSKTVVVSTTSDTVMKRYAEGSTKYAEAKDSEIAEIEVNDQVRALGEPTPDGSGYVAQHLISGAFRNIAATVSKIDAAEGVLEITDLDTKKKMLVRVTPNSTLRRLPEMAARMIAMSMNGQIPAGMGMGGGQSRGPGGAPAASQPGGQPGGQGMRPGGPGAGAARGPGAGAPGAGAPGGMMGRGGMRPANGDLSQMLARFPAFQLAELKKDEPLIVFISKTSDPDKAIGLTVLAGVEPILATPSSQSRAMMLGGWNLDGGGGGMMGGMGTP
ncbi:MAG: hypothetical protein OHK0021_01510 [Bryobacter sp.]